MKKLGKLEINFSKLIQKNELLSIRGGYGSYKCYGHLGGPTMDPYCHDFRGYINTAGCAMAYQICWDIYGGNCVDGGDCNGF